MSDHFAAAALQGLLAAGDKRWSGEVTVTAYDYADAMLRARRPA